MRIFILHSTGLSLLLLLHCLSPMVHAQQGTLDQDIAQKENTLQVIRTQIEEWRQQLGQLHGRETTLLDSIRTIEREISLLQQLIHSLSVREHELEEEIDLLHNDLLHAEGQLEAHRLRLAQRLREMYKRGRSHPLEVLLTASSPVDLFRRYKYMTAASEAERNIMLEIKREQAQLASIKDELDGKLAENRSLLRERQQEEETMHHLNDQRHRQLAVVQDRMDTSKQTIEALRDEAEQLESIIEDLEEERLRLAAQRQREHRELTYRDFTTFKGHLPWPTKGRVIHTFGPHQHPIFKTTTINKGIDIEAPLGTDIFAVATGEVILIDWLRGYGKFLIIDHHGGYYTLYAHTSEILVGEGEGIEGGERIAKVGDTGSLQGPLLHFEIRNGKQELDPLTWLRKE